MFQNRMAAIAIVIFTLAAAASLVGTENNEGALTSATQTFAEKAASSAATSDRDMSTRASPTPPAAALRAAPAQMPTEFADDESLIDDAQGYDPSPFVEDPAEGEIVVVIEGNEAPPSAKPAGSDARSGGSAIDPLEP